MWSISLKIYFNVYLKSYLDIVSSVGTQHLLRTTSILLLSSLSLLSSEPAITSSPGNLLPCSIGWTDDRVTCLKDSDRCIGITVVINAN